ncbi:MULTISPECIES: DUF3493 domain-containing protein [Fischerella]|uniref:DUF3493 domain-containing protein n=1 Tax=Fischerella muscicola CCMEE 5323 TaxID=2019572 RepID=A0A2N6JUV0_FISMU|nr:MULTISPECIES: DUF3493 domain-containing protein [Fischerella]MBD2430680.1 DUF3493 domain-containing protein [Fischerella sp. FACHB-380]PLZ82228.1 DUF3493 domain-containing protein [Fischerella muscicola CCMEE 5323]
MVQPNPENRRSQSQMHPERYARLKAEITAPYRNIRKFFYLGAGASGFIGAFIFFFQVLARHNLDTALPNFALQVGVVAVAMYLWRWESRRKS